MKSFCLLLALSALAISTFLQADERARCGKSTVCAEENVRPPFVLRNLPMPNDVRPGRLPVMLSSFRSEQIEALLPLLLLTERWLQQHTAFPVLQPPAVHNQHYPGMSLSLRDFNEKEQHHALLVWGASTRFNEAMASSLQQPGDSLLLLFIGYNTLMPRGFTLPYLSQGSWQEKDQRAKLGTDYFESLAYQAVLINHQGEVIAAATEGFQIGSTITTLPVILSVLFNTPQTPIYLLNPDDIRQSVSQCELDNACPAHQALARLLENLRLVTQGERSW